MEYRLEELFDLQMGKTPSRSVTEYWESGNNKWISIADLSKCGKYIYDTKECLSDIAVSESGIKQIPANTVVMSFKLSIGKTAITSEPMYSNEAIMSLRDRKLVQLLPEYIYYLLLSKNWDDGTNKAVMGKTLNKATLSKVKVNIHSMQEQQELVYVLNQATALIELHQQQLQKLDDLVKARFVEMFGMPGTDTKGWGLQYLGTCCELNPKKGTDKRLVSGLSVSFVPMPAVSESGKIDASQIKAYDEVKTGFTYFAENDVLFAKITPCMENGKGAVAVGLCNNIGFGSTEFHILRPINNKSNPYWLYSLTSFDAFRKDAADNMTGSAGQRRVPAVFLEKYKVTLPPIELQNQFAAFVKQTDKSKVAVQKSLDEAQLLFDSLMQQYFG